MSSNFGQTKCNFHDSEFIKVIIIFKKKGSNRVKMMAMCSLLSLREFSQFLNCVNEQIKHFQLQKDEKFYEFHNFYLIIGRSFIKTLFTICFCV